MRVASDRSSFAEPPPLRRRLTSLSFAVAVNLLLLALLLRLAPPFSPAPPKPRDAVLLDLQPERPVRSETNRTVAKATPSGGRAPRKPAPAREAARTVPPPETPPPPLNMIQMSREEFATADIARLPSNRGNSDPGTGGQGGQGADNGTGNAAGAGTGPGGEQLFYADWQREPSHAELSGYLPKTAPATGWGEVACRTVAGFRVEDCAEMGESPRGSGFSRAVRQAAWQFRVRPPRIGGKLLVGAWVRIRITYSADKAG